jgi:predicted DNA-binding transcriptional regulator AlpA
VTEKLLDVKAACQLIGGSRPIHPATFWRGVKAGRYSKPIAVGPNLRRWYQSELEADVARAAAERKHSSQAA